MVIKQIIFPERGFSESEFENRFYKIQQAMLAEKVDAILLTTKVDIHYFSGLVSQFWESPTRPVYLILPAVGDTPIAVIPEIYYESMNLTWIKKIYRWYSPCIEDDGVSLLLENLKIYRNIGMPMGLETQLRMPLTHILFIMKELKTNFNIEFIDVSKMIKQIRLIKSPAEINKIYTACQITSRAFESLPKIINDLCVRNNLKEISERRIISELHKKLIENGADRVPFIVGKSDYNGSKSIIDGPTNKIVNSEDIMIIDVGIVYDEYYCDFNRNYAINYSNDYMRLANLDLWYATEEALAIAKPGITFGDLWKAQSDYLIKKGHDPDFFETGRLGHSIGLSLTELPSVCKNEKTELKIGVVLTLEPSILLKDEKLLVHEECIVITDTGYELLTIRASKHFYYIMK
jgi:Xaa-Pro dipeptidase